MKIIDLRTQPFRTFYTIEVELGARCNRTCVFCPQHKSTRPNEFMNDTIVEKIISDLESINYKGRFTPFMYNEPLLDKRLPRIIKEITTRVPGACVMVSTNGDLLRNKMDLANLYAYGVRQVIVNIYSTLDNTSTKRTLSTSYLTAEQRYRTILQWAKDLQLDSKGSPYLYAKKGSKIILIEKKFGMRSSKDFGNYKLQNRSGNIEWWSRGLAQPLNKICVRPFRSMQLNWKGDVVLCCNDYHGITNFGNVMNASLTELWNAEGLNKYRLFLQNKRRDLPLCNKCDFDGGKFQHMIQRITFGSTEDTQLLNAK